MHVFGLWDRNWRKPQRHAVRTCKLHYQIQFRSRKKVLRPHSALVADITGKVARNSLYIINRGSVFSSALVSSHHSLSFNPQRLNMQPPVNNVVISRRPCKTTDIKSSARCAAVPLLWIIDVIQRWVIKAGIAFSKRESEISFNQRQTFCYYKL